ncbi:MAG: acyl carrier protein [Phycisphaeraceae bacterium JB051]
MTTSSNTTSELEQSIFQIVADTVSVDIVQINRETRFEDDLNFDSIDQIEFIMQVEEVYSIDVPDDQAANIKTVGQVIDLIKQKQN